ncbi:MAG TPA: undecaprenyl-diphosphatase [Porticoccaceae bacterium]|nr:undecaprenyl-diphosphatase [Porticoccaceae bacterium]HCO60077.1 undecaprenyl-diphosphatase [Porticoccaceae bacterium]
MDLLQLVLLALIQGLTEFLPISSSAHLILPAQLLDLRDQGLAFDIAVHVGSLMAVIYYLRQDIHQLAIAWFRSICGGGASHESRLVWFLALGTVPVGLGGLLFGGLIESHLRSVGVIAATTIVYALLLAIADKYGAQRADISDLNYKNALLIGLAQMLALVPGTSRSGITMTAALALGFNRREAARYSFLLAIPVIALSGLYQGYQYFAEPDVVTAGSALLWQEIVIGFLVSGVMALTCIHFFLALVERIGMMPFVWYRLALGSVLFLFVANGNG